MGCSSQLPDKAVSPNIRIGLSLPARGPGAKEAIEQAVETLARIDLAYLRAHPRTPALARSGVRYQREPRGARERWQSIPEALRSRRLDCEDAAAWRIAELRMRGFRAWPHVTLRGRIWHIRVRTEGGKILDPSRELGM